MIFRRLSSAFSLISLSCCILMCILFCFEMKSWGFSTMELLAIFVICVGLCVVFASIVIQNQQIPVTLCLISIVMLLFVVIQILSISVLDDVIKSFFLL